MYFSDFASLAHMDGQGVFVWGTCGIGLLAKYDENHTPVEVGRALADAEDKETGHES